MAMNEETVRAWEFMRRADSAGDSNEPSPLGTAVRDRRVPLRHDSNYLLVERRATAAEIAAELRRLNLPIATLPDESLLTGSTDGAQIQHRGLVMVHRGAAPYPAEPAVEVSREQLEPLRRATTLSYSWGTPEVADQLLQAKGFIEERMPTRFFAVFGTRQGSGVRRPLCRSAQRADRGRRHVAEPPRTRSWHNRGHDRARRSPGRRRRLRIPRRRRG
jgi:hypothetical protein